jgi:hypothetical protein
MSESPLLIEPHYYDETGRPIQEFDVIRVFHFTGARRKKYYMYKWVKLIKEGGEKVWVAYHLADGNGYYYHLRTYADQTRRIEGTRIINNY